MTAKFTVLGNTTLATSSASVTFSSIPGGYKDLVLVTTCDMSSAERFKGTINSDTGTNYSYVSMIGNGSTATSGSYATDDGIRFQNSDVTNLGDNVNTAEFFDYSSTTKHKSILIRDSTSNGSVSALAVRWASTAAITSISLSPQGAVTFTSGSTFRLLGVN